jgi:hypothetical protein
MKRIPRRIVPALVLIFTLSGIAAACGGLGLTAVEAYEGASNVLIAKVTSIDRSPDPTGNERPDGIFHWTITVEKVYKGGLKPGQELIFLNEYVSGSGFDFGAEKGKRFLLYLPEGPAPDGMWRRVGTGRTAFPDDAPADLFYLENVAKFRTRSFLFGVLSIPVREGEKWVYDRPSARRTITIEGNGKSYRIKTGKNGIYHLAGLEPGRYIIKPEPVHGFTPYTFQSPLFLPLITAAPAAPPPPGLPIDIKPGRHVQLDVGFKIENSVRGRLVDARGVALSRIEVALRPAEVEDPAQDDWDESTLTDAEGNFKFGSIEPGNYVIIVNSNGEITSRMPFHTFYFPGNTKREEAVEIAVHPGDDLRDVILNAPEALETITVSGRLVGEKSLPIANELVKFFDARDADNSVDLTDLGNLSVRTDAEGRFSLRLVRGRAGTLGASLYLTKGAFGKCPAVDTLLADSEEDHLEITSEPFSFDGQGDLTGLEMIVPVANCQAAK